MGQSTRPDPSEVLRNYPLLPFFIWEGVAGETGVRRTRSRWRTISRSHSDGEASVAGTGHSGDGAWESVHDCRESWEREGVSEWDSFVRMGAESGAES